MFTYEPEGWILDKAQYILQKSHPSHFAELVLQGESEMTYDLHCFNSKNKPYFLHIPWPKLETESAKKVLEHFLVRELPKKAQEHGSS